LGLGLLFGGCAATAVGVGSTAVPGRYVYITGELQATYSDTMEQIWPRTLAALQALRLTVDGKDLDATGGEITGRRADGTPFKVRLKPVGQRSTTVGVRVGTPGCRALAEYVHRAVQQQRQG
jgi:hypothetical protein